MKFFIDSADIAEIKDAVAMGMCDGVTTNPSLVAKTGRTFQAVIADILEIVSGPVSLEVTTIEYDAMMVQARDLAKIADNVVVKLPSTLEGFRAMGMVTREGISVNQTLCFSLNQAILGAQAGADYVSPFVGRLDDEGHHGMALVGDIVDVFDRYDIPTQVLAASIRHPMHCVEAAQMGAHIATMPFKVLMQMAHHPLTDIGAARFLEDWRNAAEAQS